MYESRGLEDEIRDSLNLGSSGDLSQLVALVFVVPYLFNMDIIVQPTRTLVFKPRCTRYTFKHYSKCSDHVQHSSS